MESYRDLYKNQIAVTIDPWELANTQTIGKVFKKPVLGEVLLQAFSD